jgi:hypothetical protein
MPIRDDGPELSDTELASLAPSARRLREGSWQGLLITDTGEKWACTDRHKTMREAVDCARDLLEMIRGD